jgi:hypothetical protein
VRLTGTASRFPGAGLKHAAEALGAYVDCLGFQRSKTECPGQVHQSVTTVCSTVSASPSTGIAVGEGLAPPGTRRTRGSCGQRRAGDGSSGLRRPRACCVMVIGRTRPPWHSRPASPHSSALTAISGLADPSLVSGRGEIGPGSGGSVRLRSSGTSPAGTIGSAPVARLLADGDQGTRLAGL